MKKMIEPLIWGIISGTIILLIVIFWTGWVVTSTTAENEGKKLVKAAILENFVPICVEQYLQDSNKVEKYAELKEKVYYLRDDYVKKNGWSTMPGAKSSVRGVADKCAKHIIELEERKSN